MEQEVFLGRQVIIDRKYEIFSYELLFRNSYENRTINGDVSATATVVQYALTELGLEESLNKYMGYININQEFLFEDIIELLPKDKIGIELLQPIEDTEEVMSRIKNLKARGFSLVWDDFESLESIKPFIGLIDMVKIDVTLIDEVKIKYFVDVLHKKNIKVVAKKIDNKAYAQLLHKIGCDYFQGYFYAEPEIITGRKLNPSESVIIRLMNLVRKDADVSELSRVLKESPDLSVGLLRLVNSAAFKSGEKIQNLKQAVGMMGYRQIQRWLQLLLFNRKGVAEPFSGMLMKIAATRGYFIEGLTREVGGTKDDQDMGFMTGVLSLVDTLMGMPMDKLVQEFPLDDIVVAALTTNSGLLGSFLSVIKQVEQGDMSAIKELQDNFPDLSVSIVNKVYHDAVNMANSIEV